MSVIRTPPRLSAWRERVDQGAYGFYARMPEPLRDRVRRVAYALIPILQCGIGAALAWWIASGLLGHERPFFAPIAATIALGVSMGKRLRRAAELVVGAVIGIGLGDLLISAIGSGPWQIAIAVIAGQTIAVFLDKGAIFSGQVATSAVLVATLLPPGSNVGYERMIDALIGGVIALAMMSLLPVHPIKRARRETASLLGVSSSILREVAEGLENRDVDRIGDALQSARDTQPAVDTLREQVGGGKEIISISPFHRAKKSELDGIADVLNPLDNGVRNIRVLARRAATSVEDSVEIHPKLINLIDHLADGLEDLSRYVARIPDAPDQVTMTRQLRMVAAGLQRELVSGGGITETVVLAQMRSILVDMLQVAGLSKISALATLPATVPKPAVRPEPLTSGEAKSTEGLAPKDAVREVLPPQVIKNLPQVFLDED